jgi:DNA repair exonuclease SbcCD ATPase subunit
MELDQHKATLIKGKSGSGKTTMMDVFSFVFYGKALRPINKKLMINKFNGKDCEAYCIFTKGQHLYKITRGIKPDILTIDIDGEPMDMAAGKEPQEFILDLIGLSHKAMAHVVMLSPSSNTPFMKMNAKERREIVEELRKLHVFAKMNDAAKEKVKILNKEIESDSKAIAVFSSKKSLIEGFIRESEASHGERIETLKTSIVDKEEGIQRLKNERVELVAKGVAFKTELDGLEDVSEKISTLREEISKRNERIRSYKPALNIESIEKCTTCYQEVGEEHKADIHKKASEATEKAQKYIDGATAKIAELRVTEQERTRVSKEIDVLRNLVRETDTTIKYMTGDIERIEQEIVRLEKPQEGTEKHRKDLAEALEMLSDAEESQEVLGANLAILTECLLHLKDSGIKASLIAEFIPSFNSLVNKFLEEMDLWLQFELDKDFNESVKSRGRDEFSYYSFSEGEKQRIDIAILFAWRCLCTLSGAELPNLFVLDEVLDSHTDPETIESVLDILNSLESNVNVVVISHKIESSPIFDRLIKFEMVKNYSIMSFGEI